jgi:peptide/nickel transport system substrate-binding protein
MARTRPSPSIPGRTAITAAVLVGLLGAACGPSSPSATDDLPEGGTLRVAIVADGGEAIPSAAYYDPGRWGFSPLERSLLRTLLSYNGLPTEEGGAVLRPDLAASLPEISADGLTWTFRLKPGIRYAPPLEDRVIEARDFVTAIEHTMRFGDGPPFFDGILGVREFQEGTADAIAGLEAPDATTLVVRLVAPGGEIGNAMALAMAAPLPAEALVGREHADYAGFLVASGPYMYEGASALDLADPDAEPIWSGRGNEPVVLVRNPSWDPATDDLRPAHVDRIEAILVTSPEAAARAVERGEVDVMGQPAPVDVVRRFLDSGDLRGRVFAQTALRVQYLSMNVAVPPFDDAHVRRAANLVIDRGSAAEAVSGDRAALVDVAQHVLPDVLENNLLLDYAPFRTEGDRGDVDAARAEMRASAYDGDGDGMCDDPVCDTAIFFNAGNSALEATIRANLADIGIDLTVAGEDADPFDPRTHIGVLAGIGWQADFPNAANFAALFGQRGIGEEGILNFSLMGATPQQLDEWGYDVTDVPHLEPRVEACIVAVGSDVFRCWAEVDQLLTERVMPWVPLAFVRSAWITSDRVVAFSPDAYSVSPALDQIRIRPDS